MVRPGSVADPSTGHAAHGSIVPTGVSVLLSIPPSPNLAIMPARTVALVPHTHWDREWYEPFQTFRARLVTLMDTLLPLMEGDPSYARFLLDGQLAMVDDYLEVRPEAADQVRALAVAGRLSMGPWYVLMDEFLVSPETIVRNLQMGIRRAASFGGAMDVGYLPDMFGHVAQMPQLLRLAGVEDAVVWRGVPSSVTATAFDWEAPDGSTVRAEYLPTGYGNGAALPDDAKELVRRISDHEQEIAAFLIGPMLVMNGSDHLMPQPALGRTVAEANAIQDRFRFEIMSLPEYLTTAPRSNLARWRGELRSGARANVLMGVTSNRVDVKRAAGTAERAVERRAEPYAALYLDPAKWPERQLHLAWQQIVRNAAHDSICACSVDEVVDTVLHRYAEARAIGASVATQALDALASSMAQPGPVVVNPSASERDGVVELVLAGDTDLGPHVQVVAERTRLPETMTFDAETMRTVLATLQGPRLDEDSYVHSLDVQEDAGGILLKVEVGADQPADLSVAEAKQDIYTRIGARPDVPIHVELHQPVIRRVLAKVDTVPGFGWRAFEPGVLHNPASVEHHASDGTVWMGNGRTAVVIDPRDGTFSVNGLSGFGRLVDSGDQGDSYNYSPPRHDVVVDTPETVTVEVTEPGPVRATASITATYRWPEAIDTEHGQRVGEVEAVVSTAISLHADHPLVRVRTRFVNPARDHRVRAHLPLPMGAQCSEAECAFAITRRELEIEGRPDELGLPTFPARRFVRAGGLTVVHDAVTEYELVDIEGSAEGPCSRTIALTVLRATGMLSRLGMVYRPFPAGPLTAVPGLQMLGTEIDFSYGVCREEMDPFGLADELVAPLEAVRAAGGGWRPPAGSGLDISGAVVTALQRVGGLLEARVFNPHDAVANVTVGRRGWLVDLRGDTMQPFDGSFPLQPFQIATVRLAG